MTTFRLLACSLLLTLSSICSLAADSYREVWQRVTTLDMITNESTDTVASFEIIIVSDNTGLALSSAPVSSGGLYASASPIEEDGSGVASGVDESCIFTLENANNVAYVIKRIASDNTTAKLYVDLNEHLAYGDKEATQWAILNSDKDKCFVLKYTAINKLQYDQLDYLPKSQIFDTNTGAEANDRMRLYVLSKVPVTQPVKPEPPHAEFSIEGIAMNAGGEVSLSGLSELAVTLTAENESDLIFFRWDDDIAPANILPADGFEPYTDAIAIRGAGTLSYYTHSSATNTAGDVHTIRFTGHYGTVGISNLISGKHTDAYPLYDLQGRTIKAANRHGIVVSRGSKTIR